MLGRAALAGVAAAGAPAPSASCAGRGCGRSGGGFLWTTQGAGIGELRAAAQEAQLGWLDSVRGSWASGRARTRERLSAAARGFPARARPRGRRGQETGERAPAHAPSLGTVLEVCCPLSGEYTCTRSLTGYLSSNTACTLAVRQLETAWGVGGNAVPPLLSKS